MIIDNKGKLFGKINIIDLLVIIILIVAIAVVCIKMLPGTRETTDNVTLEMKFYIEEENDFVADKVTEGVTLYDDTYDMEIGHVVHVERGTPITWAATADGRYVRSERDGFSSMIITGEVSGKKTDIGAEIDGKKYGVGHSMVLRAGDAKMYLRVYDISVKEED